MLNTATLYFDGGGQNPGLMKIAILIERPGDYPIVEAIDTDTHGTNNTAEWLALLYGLDRCIDLGIDRVTIYGDSQLVVNGVLGTYKMKKKHLKEMHQAFFEQFNGSNIRIENIEWLPRAKNIAGWLISNDPSDKQKLNRYFEKY